MSLKFYLVSFVALFFVADGFAQKKQNVYFLKNNGRYVNQKDSADFIRVVQEPDSGTVLYNVMEYYPNGNLKMAGKTSAIEPIKLEGTVASYYPDKKKKQIANYENGRFAGAVYDYFPNGKLYRVMTYQMVDKTPFSINNESIQSVYDSAGVQIVKDGTGHYQVFDHDDHQLLEEGELKNGKRNGTWKGTMLKGKIGYVEEYTDGKFMKGTSTDEAGKTMNYTVKEALPTFKGGESAFGQYLTQNLNYPGDAKNGNIQGRVILGFVVEKDGSISSVKVLKSVYKSLDDEAIKVVSRSPKWNPGIQHGVPVRVSYAMPINFSLGR